MQDTCAQPSHIGYSSNNLRWRFPLIDIYEYLCKECSSDQLNWFIWCYSNIHIM